MRVQKDLVALDSTIELNPPSSINGGIAVQYGAGAGTIVLEGRVGDQQAWSVIQMTSYANGAAVSSLAALGMAFANIIGLDAIRVRKSVGAASLIVSVNYQNG